MRQAKRADFDATSVPAKVEDRVKYANELTECYNWKLYTSYKLRKHHEIFRKSEDTWWVKRNYVDYPYSAEEVCLTQ